MGRVRIGTCANLAEAALVRAAFDAHDVHVVINAEQHASMLGGLGGAFVPLHIYVAEEDREEAESLLAELRSAEPVDDGGDDDDELDEAGDGDPADDEVAAGASQVHARVERRKRTGVVLLLATCVTFGTAHMYMGAWFRGIALAGGEILAFRYLGIDPKVGGAILAGCVLYDLVGGMLLVRGMRAKLPEARVHAG